MYGIDYEIREKFIDSYDRNVFGNFIINDLANIIDLKYKKPFDVVSGMYYNEAKDTFELYPFRVINVDPEGTVELLGLKYLGLGKHNEVKDMKFKFIFNDFGNGFVVTGKIPDRDRLILIRDNYKEDSMGNDGDMLIALGNSYWVKSSFDSDVCFVSEDGCIYTESIDMFYSDGILPYVVIEFEDKEGE